MSERAVAFITRRRTKPFYLSLHYTAPHSPWEGPEDKAIGHTSHGSGPMVEGGSLKIYASMMKSMDAGIGRVLQALRRAGLERKTLVIFTSDNGGERYSYNWPFSAQKFPCGKAAFEFLRSFGGQARSLRGGRVISPSSPWTGRQRSSP